MKDKINGCGLRFLDYENSSKEFEIYSLCGISKRNGKICFCEKCKNKLVEVQRL
jgi:hypothetical protein